MEIKEIVSLLDAKVVLLNHDMDYSVGYGFASDLMSDVLTLDANELLLITGLCNVQTLRTAEMANIDLILFVRNKEVNEQMIELAQENGATILQCSYSMFKSVGMLYTKGLKPVF
ncbi:MAG: hypothetical protein LBM25_01785 [Bacteroidales bacterium]|jgi:hypothetical protein|nr:hypothetical protein [Bacteroidales bacterium]